MTPKAMPSFQDVLCARHVEAWHIPSWCNRFIKKKLHQRSNISVPGNRSPVDKTIEETFMKHSKSHGGAGGGSAKQMKCKGASAFFNMFKLCEYDICLTAFYLDSAQITMFLCVRIVRQYINHS
jgi:hypothetical protein